ncbi:hypothetical protein OG417_38310 [Actinoallomurus sp. NBC_01490]|uniref:hypothetical protein n=1 Tax=Actinoallomurus sp. NBC_01490 TaxID=2903557 RepID=UPI002E354CC5|nr:hypothetical protein [Actinoallomurus sp. NBC_01490]
MVLRRVRAAGKWLLRELTDHDPEPADRLAKALPDSARLAAVAVPDRVGPLRDGHRVTDPRIP